MTYRYSLNNTYSSSNSASNFLWEIYRFMVKKSPDGPGWISIGESNGIIGGMGTVGIITSSSSLSSGNSWFVLLSPDSKVQILFTRSVTGTDYYGTYLTYTNFTGGSSSAIPTFNANTTVQFVANNSETLAVNNSINIAADDQAPYFFYINKFNRSLSTNVSLILYLPIDNFLPGDNYSFIFSNSNGYAGNSSANINYTGLASKGTKAFSYTGVPNFFPPCSYISYNTVVVPSNIAGNPNNIPCFPMIFLNSAAYKGYSNKVFWNPHATITQGMTINNKSYIRIGDVLLPWDGSTTPVIT